jgi:hypothetical protein
VRSGERAGDRGTGGALGEAAGSPGLARGFEFVLAAGGLRHLDRADDGFLGYPHGDIFWRDVLDLVREEDLPWARALISEAIDNPGVSLGTGLRFLDAHGDWRLMETTVRNVIEAPGDVGFVLAKVREAAPHAGQGSQAFRY